MATLEHDVFDPRGYLEEYYLRVGLENKFLLDMAAKAYRDFPTQSQAIIELGGGPTVYQLISAANCAREIHFTDFNQKSLDEVKSWLAHTSGSFNWDKFFAEALKSEGLSPTKAEIAQREALLRPKITRLLRHNLLSQDRASIGDIKYDIVSSFFASDGITETIPEWEAVLSNILSFLKKDGHLILVGVFGSSEWVSGDQIFKSTNINEPLLLSTLDELGVKPEMLEVTNSESGGKQGYDKVFFFKGQKLSK